MTHRRALALRGAVAAVVLTGTAAASWAGPHVQHDHDLPPQAAELLRRAEAALASGDGDAIDLFEQAAAFAHAPEIEAGSVRALMQDGHYREALAFAAHVAGAHPNEPLGTVLYAWLLHIGGQSQQARLRIEGARLRWPDNGDVLALHARLSAATPTTAAAPLLDDRPLAPASRPEAAAPVPAAAHVLTTAVRVAPDLAIATWPVREAAPTQPAALWIRDALGRTRSATVLHHDAALGVAVLWWPAPLGAPVVLAPSDGFPGSPAFAVGYASAAGMSPQWPVMAIGFLGMPDGSSAGTGGPRWLDVSLPAGSEPGGPVFDAAGRLQGITLPGSGARSRYLPLSAWRALAGLPVPPTSTAPATRPVPDEVYERAMPMTLQVLTDTPRHEATAPLAPLRASAQR